MMYKGFIYFSVLLLPHAAQVVEIRRTSCVLPAHPDHGTYVTNVPNGKPGDVSEFLVINITCEPNYNVEGSESVNCFNGWWPNSIPKCVLSPNAVQAADYGSRPSTCVLPPYPKHGTYVSNLPAGKPGDTNDYVTVNVTCHQGYTLEGPATILCFNGWWANKLPTCAPSPLALSTTDSDNKQLNGKRCILPQYPAHGTYVSTNIPNANPGEAYDIIGVNITCEAGFLLAGPPLVFCSVGQWSPQQFPQCVRQCRLSPHPSVKYRCLVSIEWMDGERFRDCNEVEPAGTLAKPFCQTHYYSATTLTFMECRDGQWSNSVQKCTPECGTLTKSTELILNGQIAKYGEVPWHVAIYRKTTEPYQLICGGSLISTNIVISAAHCFWDNVLGATLPASNYIVALGKLYRGPKSKKDMPQWSNVEVLRVPSRFKGRATNFQDDIAVMQLSKAIEYKAHIRPVCVDFDDNFDRRQLRLGSTGKIAGFGLTSEAGNPAQELRVVDLPFVSIETCLDTVPATFLSSITSDKICAGYNNASTAICRGDSGGGLVFLAQDRGTPRYYLRGIASTAPTNDNECNANTYTTFTRVVKHESFITLFWRD